MPPRLPLCRHRFLLRLSASVLYLSDAHDFCILTAAVLYTYLTLMIFIYYTLLCYILIWRSWFLQYRSGPVKMRYKCIFGYNLIHHHHHQQRLLNWCQIVSKSIECVKTLVQDCLSFAISRNIHFENQSDKLNNEIKLLKCVEISVSQIFKMPLYSNPITKFY